MKRSLIIPVIISTLLFQSCEWRSVTIDDDVPFRAHFEANSDGPFDEHDVISKQTIISKLETEEEGTVTALEIKSIKLRFYFHPENEATAFNVKGDFTIHGNVINLFTEGQYQVSGTDTVEYPVANLNGSGVSKLRDYVAYVYNYSMGAYGFDSDPGDLGVHLYGYPVMPNQQARFVSKISLVLTFTGGFKACYEMPVFVGEECDIEHQILVDPGFLDDYLE